MRFERKMYHAQERWSNPLTMAILCKSATAWLGQGYYFWYYESDAYYWGNTFKRKTKAYEIYSALISSENILDTVFNEAEYLFWVKAIESAAKKFVIKTGYKPTLKEINEVLAVDKVWHGIEGILFQDISQNPDNYLVEEFQYIKRIQLAVYNYNIVSNFALHDTRKCH